MPKSKKSSADRPDHPWVAHLRTFQFRRTWVQLATAHDLFSSAALDVGTSRLLRLLEKKGTPLSRDEGRPIRVLDLGCGGGAIGVSIARAMPCGTVRVVMSDRDRLALSVSRLNCTLNELIPGGDAIRLLPAGVGYEPCRDAGEEPFDLIVSNMPAKVGDGGLRELLFGAGPLLREGGCVAFVHVTPLTDNIDSLQQAFEKKHGPIEVCQQSVGKEHRALLWRFERGMPEKKPGAEFGPWRRSDVAATLRMKGIRPLSHVAVHDVDEFDSVHFRTPLLAKLIQRARPYRDRPAAERILVMNPNHGFLPAFLANQRLPAELALLGRDTLAEAVSYRNLAVTLADWDLEDRVRLIEPPTRSDFPWLPREAGDSSQGFDLITGHLLWKEGSDGHRTTLSALRNALKPDGKSLMVLSVSVGRVPILRKLARESGLRHGREMAQKGNAAVCLRRA